MKSKLWKFPLAGYVIFLLIGAVVGIQWHRLYLFPFPQIHEWRESQKVPVPLSKKTVITKYTAKTPVFLDRLYYDSIGDKRLEGLFLVQITRHNKEIIKIQANKSVTIYRFISDKNINTYFDSWSTSEIPIHVRGNTCTHTRVVKKDFPAGMISLPPGGPVASSPILIKVHGHTEAPLGFEVLD